MLAYLRDPSFFSVIARLVVIIFSLGTLHLTYLIAKKLFNGKTGIFAALFLSFSTVHYMMSTTGLADMVAAFFLLLSFYSLLKYYFRSNALKGMKYFYLSAFFLGLAMAAKLTVVPGIFCFSIIYFLKEKKWNMAIIKRLFLGFLFILLGFFIAEPYTFFNPGKFFLIFDIM